MAELTPRYEAITGSNLTGSDGATGRTYTLAYSTYNSVIEFLKQGAPLHETNDFTISNGIITFLTNIFDSDVMSLRYFTGEAAAVLVTGGYGYVTTTDVYRTSGLSSTVISTADVSQQILRAETIICRMTKNIYWRITHDAQTATSGGATTITKTSAGWTANDFVGMYVWLYSGTGSVQLREIVSNTTDTITVDRAWTTTNPASGSLFKIFYVPVDFNPYISESYDGSGSNYQYMPNYPVKKVETLSINSTSVTPSYLYLYEKTGKLQFRTTAEMQEFTATFPQQVSITYWYGVDHLPYDIKRLVELHAAIQIMGQQMGGTYDDPSTIGLPEFNVSIGQAYINIRSSLETLKEEYLALLKQVKIWPVFAY